MHLEHVCASVEERLSLGISLGLSRRDAEILQHREGEGALRDQPIFFRKNSCERQAATCAASALNEARSSQWKPWPA